MPNRITPDESRRYRDDGFFLRPAQFGPAELDTLRAGAEAAAARAAVLAAAGRDYRLDGRRFVDAGHVTIQFEPGLANSAIRVVEPVHELDPRLTALMTDARLVEPMRGLVGTPHIAVWTDKLNLKRPMEGSGFGWHQDSPYWIHDCGHVDRLPNVMVVLDDASEANGCFRVIRASHRRGLLPGTSDGSQLGGFFTDPGAFDESQQVALGVPAGTLIFFSPHLVHGSMPNGSGLPRRAVVATYQPAGFPMLKSGRTWNVC